MAIQVWTPADGFTRKTPKPERRDDKTIIPSAVAEKPTPAQPSKAKRRKPSERQRANWLKQNQLKLKDRTIADQYLVKQAKTQTPMMFIGYECVYPCTITKLWRYYVDLTLDGRKKRIHKLDMALYYKAEDAPAVEKLLTFDSDSVEGSPSKNPSERYHVPDDVLLASRKDKTPLRFTLRTGHRLSGMVKWFTAYDIGLSCDGVKVHLFRHALSTVNPNANEKSRP